MARPSTKDLKSLSGIGAVLASCGGVRDNEIAAFLLAAEDLGFSPDVAERALAEHLASIGDDDAKADHLLRTSCEALPAAHRSLAMELAVHVVLADGELSAGEVLRLTAVRMLLGVSEELLITLVAREVAMSTGFAVTAADAIDQLK